MIGDSLCHKIQIFTLTPNILDRYLP